MTDVGEFIDDYLEHEYDPIKAREYYLRTRKLKGRKPSLSKTKAKPIGDFKAPDNPFAGAKIGLTQKSKDRINRVKAINAKLVRAREKAKKLPAAKRRELENKLDALEKRVQGKVSDAQTSRAKRSRELEGRVNSARNKAKALPANKRRDIERKLDALEGRAKKATRANSNPKFGKAKPKKANELKKGLRNPFAGAKLSRSK